LRGGGGGGGALARSLFYVCTDVKTGKYLGIP